MGTLQNLGQRARRVIYGPPPPPPPPPAPVRYVWLEEAPEKKSAPPKKKRRLPSTPSGILLLVAVVLVIAFLANGLLKQAVAFSPPYNANVASILTVNAATGQVTVSDTLDLSLTRQIDHLDLPLKGAEPDNTTTGQGQVTPAQLTPGLKVPDDLVYFHYAPTATATVLAADTADLGASATVRANANGDWTLGVAFNRGASGHLLLRVGFTVIDGVRHGPSGPRLIVWPYVDPSAEYGATRGVVMPDGVDVATAQIVVPGASGVTNAACQLGAFSGAWTNVFTLAPSGGCLIAPTDVAPASPAPAPSDGDSVEGHIAAVRVVADLPAAVHAASGT